MSAEVDTITKTDIKLKAPDLYNVILLNDDYTPMDFVITILTDLFNKNLNEAELLMLEIHQKGKGIAGSFSHEVADQKVLDVTMIAQHYGHPLKAISEKLS